MTSPNFQFSFLALGDHLIVLPLLQPDNSQQTVSWINCRIYHHCFPFLRDCFSLLSDVQHHENHCFVYFLPVFSSFTWRGKSGPCYSILTESITGFAVLSVVLWNFRMIQFDEVFILSLSWVLSESLPSENHILQIWKIFFFYSLDNFLCSLLVRSVNHTFPLIFSIFVFLSNNLGEFSWVSFKSSTDWYLWFGLVILNVDFPRITFHCFLIILSLRIFSLFHGRLFDLFEDYIVYLHV